MSSLNHHHFLIHDDSATNFNLSSIPVKVACGYAFCHKSQSSTLSERAEVLGSPEQFSNQGSHIANIAYNPFNSSKKSESQIYYQSAIRKHISNMQQHYSDHKIDSAYQQAQKLVKLCQTMNHQLKRNQIDFVNKIYRQMNDVFYYQKILNEGGWQLKKQKKNLRVSTKMQNQTVGVLVEAFLDVQIQNFLSVITQIDLMKKWMPFMQYSSLEKIVARNCRIGHCVNNFPFISKRQSFFQGIGYDRMQHNKTVFMFSRSLNEHVQLQKQYGYQVRQNPDTVQLKYKYFIIQYVPLSPSTGNLRLAINVDMQLSVPMFILGPATQGFGIDFYTNVLKKAKNFKGSQWEKNVQQNPAFYNLVQRRIREYYQNRPIQY